jgi:hypothetical protein
MRTLLPLTLILMFFGCYNPDLTGPGGFDCKKTGECPEGFECKGGRCVVPGQPAPDAGGDAGGDGTPTGPCTIDPKQEALVSGSHIAASLFSAAPGAKAGDVSVSFGEQVGSQWTLFLAERAGGKWGTPAKIADNAGLYSSVAVNSKGQALVAFYDIKARTARLYREWISSSPIIDVDSTSFRGEFIDIGPGKEKRWLTYLGYPKLNVHGFYRLTLDVENGTVLGTPQHMPLPTNMTKVGLILQGGTPPSKHALAFFARQKALSAHTAFRVDWGGTSPVKLETLNSKFDDKELGMAMAPSGAMVVWSGYNTQQSYKEVKYWLNKNTSGVIRGTNPTLAFNPRGHEALAFVDNGRVELLVRQQPGAGAWSEPLTVTTTKAMVGYKVVVVPRADATDAKATWDLLYLQSTGAVTTSKLYHNEVSCSF